MQEYKLTKEAILKMMSLSKFHDIVRKAEMGSLDSIRKRFKLNNAKNEH